MGTGSNALQTAVDNCSPGDILELNDGFDYGAQLTAGKLVLPYKSGASSYVTFRPASYASLPSSTTRINPTGGATADPDGPSPNLSFTLPILGFVETANRTAASNTPVSTNQPCYYQFIGISFKWSSGMSLGTPLIWLGSDGSSSEGTCTSTAQQPDNFIFDRCWVYAPDTAGVKRGMFINTRNITIKNSHIASFWFDGSEAQAVQTANGTGPFTITNNYLESSTQNFMLGGGGCASTLPGPGNLTFTNNYCHKPDRWLTEKLTTYSGIVVKNLFELKNCRTAVIEDNTFDGIWYPSGQNGSPILFTPRNQSNGAPNAAVKDITFRNNLIKRVDSGGGDGGYCLTIQGWDDEFTNSEKTSNILIENNLFDCDAIRGVLLVSRGCAGLVIKHTTFLGVQARVMIFTSPSSGGVVSSTNQLSGFVFKDNVINTEGDYGIADDGGIGLLGANALTTYATGYSVTNNVMARNTNYEGGWPSGNTRLVGTTIASCLDADRQVVDESAADIPTTDGVLVGYLLETPVTSNTKVGWLKF